MPGKTAILYARLPGLLAAAAQRGESSPRAAPVAVETKRTVRDACPVAFRAGVRVGQSVVSARRLCPALLVIPQEEIDATRLSRLSVAFYEPLTVFTSLIEPDGLDAVFADLSDAPPVSLSALSRQWEAVGAGFPAVVGVAPSKNAARACAEGELSAMRLADADARFLWPEDLQIATHLFRLGLATYGAVAEVCEAALVYQFGKVGRLLHRRALGQDFAPVRAVWPPPRAVAALSFDDSPLQTEPQFAAALSRLAGRVAGELVSLSRHGRRVTLCIENDEGRGLTESLTLPLPVQSAPDVQRQARRLLALCRPRLLAPALSLRLIVDELERPAVQTIALFPDAGTMRGERLSAVRKNLVARFHSRIIGTLGERPLSRREQRLARVGEYQRAQGGQNR